MDRKPLTPEDLHEIGQRLRNIPDPQTKEDMKALLWEIKRLQSFVVRLDQVHRSEYRIPTFLQEAIENELKVDPYVIARKAIDSPEVKPGDEDLPGPG